MTTKIISLLVIAMYALLVISCSNDDTNSNEQTTQQIVQIAQNGTWKITYFFDSDHEETGDFAGYVFSFKNDGTLVAENGTITITGTWSVTDDNSTDDDGGASDKDFNIFFNVPADHDFDDLIDDWDIITISNTKLELKDVSGGNGGTDLLTFERI